MQAIARQSVPRDHGADAVIDHFDELIGDIAAL